jgi:hypothetical protein
MSTDPPVHRSFIKTPVTIVGDCVANRTFADGFRYGWRAIAGADSPMPPMQQQYPPDGPTAYILGIKEGMEAANDSQPLRLKLESVSRKTVT